MDHPTPPPRPPSLHTRAFTLYGLMGTIAAATIVLSLTVPVIAVMRLTSGVDCSLGNLQTLGVAHAMYAFDWNGRQYTNIADDISDYGNSPAEAFVNFEDHPGLIAGLDGQGQIWGWYPTPNNAAIFQPISFNSITGAFGSFRLPNAKPIHDYVSGRFYDPTYYAPQDVVVDALVAPLFEEPFEFVPTDAPLGAYWSSYCTSPAAQIDPAVMRSNAAGGWQHPWGLSGGFTSPAFESVQYADLKTHLIEHHWLQNGPPEPCNPVFNPGTYDGCEPYYFNHGMASAPATLFYDGHTRLLPNSEVHAADQVVLGQTGGQDGLWHRATPFGNDGYFNSQSYDQTNLAHHVLTTDGINGRDTLANESPPSEYGPRDPKRPRLDEAVHTGTRRRLMFTTEGRQ